MLYSSLGLSIFMLVAIILGVTLMFKRLKLITPFNISIYLVLALFWISTRIFSEQVPIFGSTLPSAYVMPIIVGLMSLLQVFVRLPLGKLSQRLISRKTIIVVAISLFVILAVPFIAVQNTATFVLMALGAGFFASTFGLENQYFSENWSLRHVFITVALVSFLPTTGTFVASIFRSSFEVANHDLSVENYILVLRWILLVVMVLTVVVLALYFFFHKERRETIRKDNMGNQNVVVASISLKELLRLSLTIFFVGFANQLVFRSTVSKISDGPTWTLVSLVVLAFSVILAVATSLYLIRVLRVYVIVTLAQAMTFVGIVLGLVLWFGNVSSFALSFIFIFIFVSAVTMYETTLIGVMVHFDHKSPMLVLGIWLTVRSGGYALGDFAGGTIEVSYAPDQVGKWVVLAGALLLICAYFSTYFSRRVRSHIYKMVDLYENNKYSSATREPIWK